eukprot:TRINITY_DN4016_c0_g1_i1.p3 TRINITY_DN4016_c0_g1~~TRINITY_DN4016_c0_g1_i1.p3  ORF type:complete len:205 (+),score=-13.62 TRINITY_DN4016_c0_g1_i1:945-1559(+)
MKNKTFQAKFCKFKVLDRLLQTLKQTIIQISILGLCYDKPSIHKSNYISMIDSFNLDEYLYKFDFNKLLFYEGFTIFLSYLFTTLDKYIIQSTQINSFLQLKKFAVSPLYNLSCHHICHLSQFLLLKQRPRQEMCQYQSIFVVECIINNCLEQIAGGFQQRSFSCSYINYSLHFAERWLPSLEHGTVVFTQGAIRVHHIAFFVQ